MLNKSVTCQLETGSYGNSSKVTSDTDKLVNIKCIKHVKHYLNIYITWNNIFLNNYFEFIYLI